MRTRGRMGKSNCLIEEFGYAKAGSKSDPPYDLTIKKTVLVLHARQEALVAFGLLHAIKQEFHRFNRIHFSEEFPQYPDLVQDLIGQQQFFLTGG